MVCTLIVAPARDRISNRSGSYNVGSRAGLERLAQTSELFANAVAEFIAQHDRDRLTERLNAVYADAAHEPPDLGLAALQPGRFRAISGEAARAG